MPFLSSSAEVRGDAPALLTPEGDVSFKALQRNSEKVARQLVTLGVVPGDLVALKGHQDAECIAAIHGIWKAGCILAPLNPRLTEEEEARALEILKPQVVLVGKDSVAPPSREKGLQILTLGPTVGSLERLGDLWPDTSPLPSPSEPESWKGLPAAILLTSGTAGAPGLVTLSFGNLWASAEGARHRLDLLPDDRWLASLSFAHVGGLALVSRCAYLGSGLVLDGAFKAESFAALVDDGRVTHASLVPTMLHQFLDVWSGRPVPPSLRCLLVGGAQANESLLERGLDLGLPLALTYGLTEASSQVATAPPALVREKPGTVGSPLPGVEVKLTDEGEVLVRGATVSPEERGEDGWLRTGDLAHQDEDGHLWLRGRISHRIITGGVNVDPSEVEAVLRTHPEVFEVAVVGIPDPKWGERVVAAVVAREKGALDLGDLNRLSRGALSPAKRPKTILSMEALPRNPNGKVDRGKVRALFR
jgi:O-succinylbenzoic acid--CoA ligase